MNVIPNSQDNRISIIQFMTLIEVGTTVHVKATNSILNDVTCIHKVRDANGVMEFITRLYQRFERVLQVTEITTFSDENGNVGLEVLCK